MVKLIFTYGICVCVCVCMYSFSLPLLPPPSHLCVCVHIYTHIPENKEALSDDDASDFHEKKMGQVVADYAGCPRQGWTSGDLESVNAVNAQLIWICLDQLKCHLGVPGFTFFTSV